MAAKPQSKTRDSRPQRWSRKVTERSNALDLEAGVFTWEDPRAIAASLEASAEASTRRKAAPYRSALSLLCFYLNRAGRKLPEDQRSRLEAAKEELRVLFGGERCRPSVE